MKDRLQNDASGESKPLDPAGDWHQPLETQGEDYTVVSRRRRAGLLQRQ